MSELAVIAYPGRSLSITLRVTNTDGTPKVLTGRTVRFSARGGLLLGLLLAGELVADGDKLRATFSGAQTSALNVGQGGVFEIAAFATSDASAAQTLATGRFYVERAIAS